MRFQDYLKLKKLVKKFSEQQSTLNQDIYISDIFIYPTINDHSYGEGKQFASKYKSLRLVRLNDHIKSLATIANLQHRKNYCEENMDGTYSTKDDCLNKITRLSLNEFSLYPSSSPLTQDELNFLINQIYLTAKNMHENVHLLLASIPFVTEDKQILNITLYVQCGKDPIVKSFCKGRAHKIDVSYKNTINFSQQDDNSSYDFKLFNVSSYIANEKDTAISNDSVFFIKTEGGAEYTQVIEVCLDHAWSHAKELMKTIIKDDKCSIIPDQIDHLVTSNSIDLEDTSKVADTMIQIDPRVRSSNDKKTGLLTELDLKPIENKKYASMNVKKPIDKIIVSDPPFGSNYIIAPQQERKLDGFSHEFKDRVAKHNKKAKKRFINDAARATSSLSRQYKDFNSEYLYTIEKVYYLITALQYECIVDEKPGKFETFFATKSYQNKCQAKHYVEQAINEFKKLFEDVDKNNFYFMHHVDILINDLKFKIEHIGKNHPSPLIGFLISVIDRYQTQIKPVKQNFNMTK